LANFFAPPFFDVNGRKPFVMRGYGESMVDLSPIFLPFGSVLYLNHYASLSGTIWLESSSKKRADIWLAWFSLVRMGWGLVQKVGSLPCYQ